MWFDEDAENGCPTWGSEWCFGSYSEPKNEWDGVAIPEDDWAVNPPAPNSDSPLIDARAAVKAELADAFGSPTRAIPVRLVRARYGVRVLCTGNLYLALDEGRIRGLEEAKTIRVYTETVKAVAYKPGGLFSDDDVVDNKEEFHLTALNRVYARLHGQPGRRRMSF